MNDTDRAEARQALQGALITEAVSVAVLAVLWGVIRYRTELGQLAWRARTWQARRQRDTDAAIREAWRDISRMEHEQWQPGDKPAPGR